MKVEMLSALFDAAGRAQRLTLVAVAGLVALLLMATGVGGGVDSQLQAWRDGIRSRPASGKLVLVEIDARSLASIGRWPWPRSTYAQAVRELDRQGAAAIGFDVDFSARSAPAQDRLLASAIAASRAPIFLATFRQTASEAGNGVVENLPLDELRPHAMLGAVNIFADPDGLVRSYPYGFTIGGAPRPSIAALLINANGRINSSFPIDGAIDPETIPRISFIDLLEGRAPAAAITGKTLLIGASAIELGDRYAVPRHGVLPGALIQLLAAETLHQGTAPFDRGALPPLAMALVALTVLLRPGFSRGAGFAVLGTMLLAMPLATELIGWGTLRIAPALAGLAAAAGAAAALATVRKLHMARVVDIETGLANRRALADVLESGAAPATVIGLRLQNYAEVLGVMGRTRAAELMTRVADRLAVAAGGAVYLVEEGALAWLVADQAEGAFHSVESARAMLRPGIDIAGRHLELDFSLGIADADPRAAADAIGRALLAADTAHAKGAAWERYSEALDQALDWRLSLVGEVHQAMAAGDLWVAYQPKLDLATDRIGSLEALVRWTHPARGVISPAEFIPTLEANGKIFDLTLFVLERTLRDMGAWREVGRAVHVAVNVSAQLPSDPSFAPAVERLLGEHGIPPQDLILEVTESMSLVDPEVAIAALERLSAIGVGLSIDDYGTGQSTLSYLKRLPAREIKIDQSFVRALDTSRSDQAMVRSTIELAHELGFKVVAEGVESAAVLDLLRGFGCDVVQGWHVGRPVPAAQILPYLTAEPARAAA